MTGSPAAPLCGSSRTSSHQPIVLIVEDDPGVQHALAEVLSLAGYQVDLAADGLDGLERVGQVHPDLVLLDLMMPSFSGWRFLEECAQRDVRPPVVVLSGINGLHDYPASLGVQGYLTKPFHTDVLLDTVARLVSGHATA